MKRKNRKKTKSYLALLLTQNRINLFLIQQFYLNQNSSTELKEN